MVRAKGVEPSLPREPDPKSGASTNSATRAPRSAAPGRRAAYYSEPSRLVNAESRLAKRLAG